MQFAINLKKLHFLIASGHQRSIVHCELQMKNVGSRPFPIAELSGICSFAGIPPRFNCTLHIVDDDVMLIIQSTGCHQSPIPGKTDIHHSLLQHPLQHENSLQRSHIPHKDQRLVADLPSRHPRLTNIQTEDIVRVLHKELLSIALHIQHYPDCRSMVDQLPVRTSLQIVSAVVTSIPVDVLQLQGAIRLVAFPSLWLIIRGLASFNGSHPRFRCCELIALLRLFLTEHIILVIVVKIASDPLLNERCPLVHFVIRQAEFVCEILIIVVLLEQLLVVLLIVGGQYPQLAQPLENVFIPTKQPLELVQRDPLIVVRIIFLHQFIHQIRDVVLRWLLFLLQVRIYCVHRLDKEPQLLNRHQLRLLIPQIEHIKKLHCLAIQFQLPEHRHPANKFIRINYSTPIHVKKIITRLALAEIAT